MRPILEFWVFFWVFKVKKKVFFIFLNDKVMRIFSGFWKDLSVCSSKSGFGVAIKEEKDSL